MPAQPHFQNLSNSAKDKANERAYALLNEQEKQQVKRLTDIFNEMDTKKDGHVTQEAFRRYVQKHPKGWPLVDLFRAKTMNQNERDMLVNFWFRKLDVAGNGYITYTDFISMFHALRNTKVQESLYTDFLINLFDDNMDGKIDREEFTKMMHVLFGEEPPQAILDWMPEEGLDREALTRVMHSISMDYQLLPTAVTGGMNRANSGMFNLGVTESRVWNAESGIYEVTNSATNTPSVVSPTTTGPAAGKMPTTNQKDAREAAKARNKERKAEADGASIALAIAATAAITTGICVFVAVYARKAGHF